MSSGSSEEVKVEEIKQKQSDLETAEHDIANAEAAEQKKKEASSKLFNVKDLIAKAKAIHEVYDEDLGTIRYVYLSYDDLNKVDAMLGLTIRQRSYELLARQLAPAADVSAEQMVEDLKHLPYDVVVRLLFKLQGEGSFFYHKPKPATSTLPTG